MELRLRRKKKLLENIKKWIYRAGWQIIGHKTYIREKKLLKIEENCKRKIQKSQRISSSSCLVSRGIYIGNKREEEMDTQMLLREMNFICSQYFKIHLNVLYISMYILSDLFDILLSVDFIYIKVTSGISSWFFI